MSDKPAPIMPRALQLTSLKRIFRSLNPDADPEEIKWDELFDDILTFPENRLVFSETYPGYIWFREGEFKQVKATVEERLSTDVDFLTFAIKDLPEKTQQELAPIIEQLRKRAMSSLDLSRTARRLRKQVTELKKVAPPPPPPVRPSEKESKMALRLGKRILEAPDLFQALGVPQDTGDEEVKIAFRELSTFFHPDVYAGPRAGQIQRKLNEAREKLSTAAGRSLHLAEIAAKPTIPTIEVQVGRPVIYCTRCLQRGIMSIMEYQSTATFKSGRSIDTYKCPNPICLEEKLVNFMDGVLLGL